jgi:hypothetical protein
MHGDAVRKREILEARVAELERQLRDRLADAGDIEDDRPQLRTPEASLYYRDFWRLLQATGMGAVNLDWLTVREWAVRNGEDPDDACDILFGLLSSYREIDDELKPKPK